MRKGSFLPKILFLVMITASFSCSKKLDQKSSFQSNVLAMIGEKKITVNDFIRRCEYVPRPNYCKNNNYIHKKIALNSLIAEKLLSIEFEKEKFELSSAQKNLIKGQKEQAMRHAMLKTFGFDKVEDDLTKISLIANNINREYEIDFLILDKAQSVKFELENSKSLSHFIKLNGVIINPSPRSLTINDEMPILVKETLFFTSPQKNIVYGPIALTKNEIMYFEIKSWNTSVSVTNKQKEESFDIARKTYKEVYALKDYEKYVSNLMRGKTIYFDKINFPVFSERLSQIYLIEKDRKESVIQGSIWGEVVEQKAVSFDDLRILGKENLLVFDGKDFSVGKVLDMIKKHPLVFRNKKISSNSFGNELKYALVDLFRDNEITKEAYKLKLNDKISVIQVEQKWRDHINSILIKDELHPEDIRDKKLSKILVSKIDSLQNIYSSIIKIDTDKFEQIKLTNIDMNVIYTNQSYPIFEPEFPILTNDHKLDYGQKHVFN